MSESSKPDNAHPSEAFEFVVGTLRGAERTRFEQRLLKDTTLQEQVHFWEEQLFELHTDTIPLQPPPALWAQIEGELPPLASESHSEHRRARVPATSRLQRMLQSWRDDWLQWALPSAITAVLFLFLLPLQEPLVSPVDDVPIVGNTGDTKDDAVNTALPDYVAVMTEDEGKAVLTALTTGDGKALTLEFSSELELAASEGLQIWALSRRDNQVRSLVVLDTDESQSVALDTAQWRLIKDAEYLLLTREEKGGSSIDEPSSDLIARGYCVRLKSGSA